MGRTVTRKIARFNLEWGAKMMEGWGEGRRKVGRGEKEGWGEGRRKVGRGEKEGWGEGRRKGGEKEGWGEGRRKVGRGEKEGGEREWGGGGVAKSTDTIVHGSRSRRNAPYHQGPC